MSTLPISVDPDAINEYVAQKIIDSALGERLHETVEEALKALGKYGSDPLKSAVTSEVNKQMMQLVTDEYADTIRDAVRAKLTGEFIDSLVDGFVRSITAQLDRGY